MVDLNSPPPMYASALVIDPADPSTIAQLSHSTHSESQMSALVGSHVVPKGKYRILPAADPTRALEMQFGTFKVHVVDLDESRKKSNRESNGKLETQNIISKNTASFTVENNPTG